MAVCQVVVNNTVRAAGSRVYVCGFRVVPVRRGSSWHQGPQMQASKVSGPLWTPLATSLCVCVRAAAEKGKCIEQNADRWMKANNWSRKERQREKVKHAEADGDNRSERAGEIVYRAMHLNFFSGFKNVVSENASPFYRGTTLAECETK